MEVEEMADVFKKLYLHGKSAISIEQLDPDYVLHIDSQPIDMCGSDARLAATSSNHSVRLYSRYNLATVGCITGHDNAVSGVRFAHHDQNTLYTSSHDGTIKSWDLRCNLKYPSIVFEGYDKTKNVFTAFDLGCNDRLLCAGTEGNKDGDCHLIFWDSRSGQRLGVYADCHQHDVTQVHFHPRLPDKLISGSTDGLVNVFDVAEEGEDEALQTSLNSESSVAQIGWCGPDQQHVYCLTHIETLHVWETATDEFDTIAELKDVKETYKGADIDYMVDCFQPEDSDTPMVVLGDKKGTIHLASLEGSELHHRLTLDAAHQDVVRCLNWDPKTQTLVTGGEDAMLCLWSPHAAAPTQTDTTQLKVKAQSKMKPKIRKDARPF